LESRFLEKLDSELLARKETEKRLMLLVDQRVANLRSELNQEQKTRGEALNALES